ncbi:MAG TPA: 4'-phosphopantetheinyl transferase superfamily protein [Terriglobales bacterium]|nr:4'-phosphopantetheinyl transferase superfamily protein [Terriglobales bacterium]
MKQQTANVSSALNWPRSVVPDSIPADEVHIWAWTFETINVDPSPHIGLLDSQELERMNAFYFARDRARFAMNHANVRRILGVYLHQAPEQIRFAADRFGKPELVDRELLAFNLSHSRSVAVLALAQEGPVGVDVENVRPIEPEVATRHFSPAECAALKPLQGDEWLNGFYRCWTRKEAILKAEGIGLHRALDSFDVELRPEEPAALLASRESLRYAWKLHHLDPAAGTVGALATANPNARLSCFSFLPS